MKKGRVLRNAVFFYTKNTGSFICRHILLFHMKAQPQKAIPH